MIAPQFLNKINSSVFLWVNNLLCQKGSGYINYASNFYPLNSNINGLYVYGAPFCQFISDSSVSGSVVPTGIYINGNYVNYGESGFSGFNYERGWAYFGQNLPANTVVSGSYSVKDFNVELTDETEERILFENKMSIRPKTTIRQTGIAANETTYPVIFIKNDGYKNTPFSLGGTEKTEVDYSIFIFSDSKQQSDALEGLLCDSKYDFIPIFEKTEMPYDGYGRLKNNNFNYLTVMNSKVAGSRNTAMIEDVYKSQFSQKIYTEIKSVNPEAHFSLISIKINAIRNPRNT